MSDYGTATIVRVEDGTLTVAGDPDKTIGVHTQLYEDAMLPGHRHADGTMQLDCAGHYRYRKVGQDTNNPDVLIFELLPDQSQDFGHSPQYHVTGDATGGGK